MNNNFPEFDLSAYWQEPDFLLTDLVSLLANRLESDMGITLMIKGAILTGTLVSEREYLSTLNNLFKTMARGSSNKPTREQLEAIDEAFGFDDLTEDSYPERADDDEDEVDDDEAAFGGSPIRHLHLKDPVIIYPGSTLSFTESLLPILRIRLIMIDGWMLGRITVMRDDDDIPDIGLIQ